MRTITITIFLLCSIVSAQTTEQWSKLERGMTEQQAVKIIGSPLDSRESRIGKICYYQESEKSIGTVKYKKATSGRKNSCIVVSWKEPNWDLMPEPAPVRRTAVRPKETPVVVPVSTPKPIKNLPKTKEMVSRYKPVRRQARAATPKPVEQTAPPVAVVPVREKWNSWYWLVLGIVFVGGAFLLTLKYRESWH